MKVVAITGGSGSVLMETWSPLIPSAPPVKAVTSWRISGLVMRTCSKEPQGWQARGFNAER